MLLIFQLDLSGNQISILPSIFCSFDKLVKFYIEGSLLAAIPSWCSKMSSIVALSLRDNKITGTPFTEEFGEYSQKLKVHAT